MSENRERTGDAADVQEQSQAELSPSEKIEGEQPVGSRTPGIEKPESEVQSEVNPNTE